MGVHGAADGRERRSDLVDRGRATPEMAPRGPADRPGPISCQAPASPPAAGGCGWPSGEQRDRPEPREGGGELGLPGPARREVEGGASRAPGEPPDDGEQPPPQGLGGDDPGPETEAGRPAEIG